MASNSDKVHANYAHGVYSNLNTIRNTQWSLNTWNEWRHSNNRTKSETDTELVPSLDELPTLQVKVIDSLLKRFVEDIKTPDGNDYPPDSIRNILYGIQRHLRTTIPDINLFEKYPATFKSFQEAYSKKIKAISMKGITAKKKQAQAVSEQTEKKLWEKGAFHFHNSVGLSNAVFFYTSKIFGLIAGESLRKMDTRHFRFDEDSLGKYIELDGEFAQSVSCRHYKCGMDPADGSIRHYQDADNQRCYYNLMVHYFKQIQKAQLTGPLFLKPLQDNLFSNQALGENNLSSKVSHIMKTYEIEGYYTNHSIILGVSMIMNRHAMNLRKLHGSAYSILDVCRALDPPKGTVEETEAILLPLAPASSRPATGTFFLQQQGTQFILQQKSNIYQHAVLPAVSLALATPAQVKQIVKTKVTALQNRPIQPKIKQEILEEQSQSAVQTKHVFPLYLSAADSTSMSNEGQGESHTADEDQYATQEEKNQNILVIKEEPVEEFDHSGSETATIMPEKQVFEQEDSNDTSNSGMSTTITSTNNDFHVKEDSSTTNMRKRKIDHTNPNTEVDYEPKIRDKSKQSKSMNTAEVVLSFNKNFETGMLKQEVDIRDNYQAVFTSSSAYKTGRPVPDFDITLGDFLPEHSLIRPSDIHIKRIATPDGGKIVLNVKYTDSEV